MLESKGGRIALLFLMAAVLVYTMQNYAKGQTNALILGFALFIAVTTGSRIIVSLIDDFRKK